MSKYALNVEESFLEKAREQHALLRLSLANRERLSVVITAVCRYDINVETDGQTLTLPKKDISHISYETPLLPDEFFQGRTEEAPSLKSRVQDEFLERYVKEKTLALLSMVNGDEFRGVLEGYDGFTLSLKTSRGQTLLYKHGLCRIGPGYRRRTGPEREHAN